MSTAVPKPLLLSLTFLLMFILIAATFKTSLIETIDYFMLQWFLDLRTEGLIIIMEGFAFIGSTESVFILSAVIIGVLFIKKAPLQDLFFTASVMLSTGVLNTAIKHGIGRIRPEDFMVVELTTYSFPSGHTMGAMSLYGVLTFLLWKRISHFGIRVGFLVFAAVMIIGMGLSRIFLGVHYLTDVLGGFSLSAAILTFFYWLFYTKKKRHI